MLIYTNLSWWINSLQSVTRKIPYHRYLACYLLYVTVCGSIALCSRYRCKLHLLVYPYNQGEWFHYQTTQSSIYLIHAFLSKYTVVIHAKIDSLSCSTIQNHFKSPQIMNTCLSNPMQSISLNPAATLGVNAEDSLKALHSVCGMVGQFCCLCEL